MSRRHPELLAVAWQAKPVSSANRAPPRRAVRQAATWDALGRCESRSRRSGLSAPVVPLGLDRTGALEVPRDFAETGWWTGGARPGERGPAVVVGHVDSSSGPAVFFRLGDLPRGDAITVERVDGSRVRFRVKRSGRYPKARFPTAQVYGPTRAAALRLITCSGTFDRATGHYLDNTVVDAGR
jgi:hypothetical protein